MSDGRGIVAAALVENQGRPATYQLIFNGEEKTLAAGLFVFSDADPFGTGVNVDALLFLAQIEESVAGDKLLIGALSGPQDAWNTTALPTAQTVPISR